MRLSHHSYDQLRCGIRMVAGQICGGERVCGRERQPRRRAQCTPHWGFGCRNGGESHGWSTGKRAPLINMLQQWRGLLQPAIPPHSPSQRIGSNPEGGQGAAGKRMREDEGRLLGLVFMWCDVAFFWDRDEDPVAVRTPPSARWRRRHG